MKLSHNHQEHISITLNYMKKHRHFFGDERIKDLENAFNEYLKNIEKGYSTVTKDEYRILVLASLLAIEYKMLDN